MIRRILLTLAAVLIAITVTAPAAHCEVTMVHPDPVHYPTWVVPCNHPIAAQYGLSCAPPPPTLAALPLPAPPAADEWETTASDQYGNAQQPYLRRTADRAAWLELGQEYDMPYGFRIRALTVAPSGLDGRFYVLSEVTRSTGDPEVGRILKSELYAPMTGPMGIWWKVGSR